MGGGRSGQGCPGLALQQSLPPIAQEICVTTHLFIGCQLLALLLLLSASPALALPGFPLDTQAGISDFTDPNYPTPEIGQRELTMTFTPPAGATDIEVRLQYAGVGETTLGLDPFQCNDASCTARWGRAQVDPVSRGATAQRARFIMPNTGDFMQLLPLPAKNKRKFGAGERVRYRWAVKAKVNGVTQTWLGDIHEYVTPRPVVIAILGDSFGSGEGAPEKSPAFPWIQDHHNGELCHRSAVSGQELAVRKYIKDNPTLAIRYYNVACSGAVSGQIMTDRQYIEIDGKPVAAPLPQAKQLERWLQRESICSTASATATTVPGMACQIDLAIMSIGGNDMDFSTIVKAYLGIKSIAGYGLPVKQSDHTIRDSDGGLLAFTKALSRSRTGAENAMNSLNNRTFALHQGLLTKYPSPMGSCPHYMDVVLAKLGPIMLPLRFNISAAETAEIQSEVVPANDGKGLNKMLAEAIKKVSGWELVDQPARINGMCEANRHFVRPSEVSSMVYYYSGSTRNLPNAHNAWAKLLSSATQGGMPGPNETENAVHPNRRGHRDLYRVALEPRVSAKLDLDYRRTRAKSDGLAASTPQAPDLAQAAADPVTLDGFSDNLFQTNTAGDTVHRREFTIDGSLTNLGKSASGAVDVDIYLAPDSHGRDVYLGQVSLSSVDVSTPTQVSKTFTRETLESDLAGTDHAAFGFSRLVDPYTDASKSSLRTPTDRDRTLAHFFPRRFKAVVVIDPLNAVAETNEANNVGAHSNGWAIKPHISTLTISAVLQDLTDLHPTKTFSTLTKADLGDPVVREFFGIASPVLALREGITTGQPYRSDELLDTVSGELDTLPSAGRELRSDRVRYILSALGAEVETGLTLDGRIDLSPGALPADGRVIDAVYEATVWTDEGVQELEETPFQIQTEMRHARLTSPEPDSVLDGGDVSVAWAAPPSASRYRLSVGVQQGDYWEVGVYEAETTSAELTGLPTDGRPLYIQLETQVDGQWGAEEYVVMTAPLNAQLHLDVPSADTEEHDAFTPLDLPLSWAGVESATAYRVSVGTEAGDASYFTSEVMESTVTELWVPHDQIPQNGRAVVVTLSTQRDGEWFDERHVVRAPASGNPALSLPAGADIGEVRTLSWERAAYEATAYELKLGTSADSDDLFAGAFGPDETHAEIPVLPFGVTVHATLSTQRGETWSHERYVFARADKPTLTEPGAGAELGQVAVVSWEAPPSSGAQRIEVTRIAPDSSEEVVVADQALEAQERSAELSGLPQDGSVVVISVGSQIDDAWVWTSSMHLTQGGGDGFSGEVTVVGLGGSKGIEPPTDPGGGVDDDGGCSTAAPSGTWAWLACWAFAALLVRRRRLEG